MPPEKQNLLKKGGGNKLRGGKIVSGGRWGEELTEPTKKIISELEDTELSLTYIWKSSNLKIRERRRKDGPGPPK